MQQHKNGGTVPVPSPTWLQYNHTCGQFSHEDFNMVQKQKLDGVGPIDNRPSTDKLHHFVRNFFFFNVTRDTRHVTCDMFGGVNILSKFQLPSSYRL